MQSGVTFEPIWVGRTRRGSNKQVMWNMGRQTDNSFRTAVMQPGIRPWCFGLLERAKPHCAEQHFIQNGYANESKHNWKNNIEAER